MSDSKSNLTVFCTEQNWVRSTYFSDTYRAIFELDGVTKTWDITHIEFPFAQTKEQELKARFGISDDELIGFYKQFAICVQNGMRVANYITALPDELPDDENEPKRKPVALKQASALFTYREIKLKEDVHGSDIWLVTEPMEPFVGSEYFSGTSITLRNLLSFAARTAQSINNLASFGLHLGALDLDTILLQSMEGKKFFCFGSFLYAGSAKSWPNMKGLKTLPETADPVIRAGEAPSLVTDMHSLAAVLWSMLSGKSYRDAPDYNITPKYAPQELLEALAQARVSDDPDTLRVLYKALSRTIKEIGNKRQQDVVIHIEQPKQIVIHPEAPPEKEHSAEPREQPKNESPPDATAEPKEGPQPTTEPKEGPQPTTEPKEGPQPTTEPKEGPQPATELKEGPQPATELKGEAQPATEPKEGPQPATELKGEAKDRIESEKQLPQKAEVVAELIAVPIRRSDFESTSEAKARSVEARPTHNKKNPTKLNGTSPTRHSPAPSTPTQTPAYPQDANSTQQQTENLAGTIPPGTQPPMQGGQGIYSQGVPYVMPAPIFVLPPNSYPGYGPIPQYPSQGLPPQNQNEAQRLTPHTKADEPKPGGKAPTQAKPKQQLSVKKTAAQRAPTAAPAARTSVKAATTVTPAPAVKGAESSVKPDEDNAKVEGKKPPDTEATAGTPSRKVVRRIVRTVKKRKKKSKVVSFLLILFLLAALAFLGAAGLQYTGYDVPWNIPLVNDLRGGGTFTVTPDKITLHPGEETILTSSEGCTLSSSDHNVAIVSDTGHVKGVGLGTCTITARASSSSAIVHIQVTVEAK